MLADKRWARPLIAMAALAVTAGAAQAQRVTGKQQFDANEAKAVNSYVIEERTRGERVAIGEVNDVLRWGATNQYDQRFVFRRLPTGQYRIESLRDGGERRYLGVGDNGHLVRWWKADNKTQEFSLEWNADGSVSLKEPTRSEYVSVSDGAFGRLIRWGRLGDDGARTREQTFFLRDALRYEDVLQPGWTQKLDEAKRETVTTIPYPRSTVTAQAVGELKTGSDVDGAIQKFRPIVVERQTQQAFNQKSTFIRFSLTPVVVRMKNNLVVSLTDNSDFNNQCFTKENHWVGFFLDSVDIKYRNQAGGWSSPEWGPKPTNRGAGYSHSKTFGVDASLGLDGKTPQASVGANASVSSGTDASIMDIEFSANAPSGVPSFRWQTAQAYDGRDKPIVINGNWWNMVRKTAAQIDLSRSVYDAPDLAKSSFQSVAYCAWQPRDTASVATAAGQDMRIVVEYTVGYRGVRTANLATSGGEGFLRGFSAMFGLNPDMYSGEAFRRWSTSVIQHKFEVEVVIPRDQLKSLAAQ